MTKPRRENLGASLVNRKGFGGQWRPQMLHRRDWLNVTFV